MDVLQDDNSPYKAWDPQTGAYQNYDDTYGYIEDKNPAYEASNLVDSTFSLNKLNLIILIDKSGKKVWF